MEKGLVILDDDKAYARARIAELEQEILAMGPEFHDAFNQSSETWHDNAPFEALRDRQSVLDAELQNLKSILRRSVPSVPKQLPGRVGIGSVVRLDNGKTYLVAGDWTPHAGQMKNGAIVISCKSSLAAALLGKSRGSKVATGIIEAIL